ncbi:CHASE2 domain-containing protein [Chryseosolibacter indicus]|uniref:CHASE2 domain-containing protein n=1 Tax=Chryseosolibacter indicus TaxID=2782351 RepID=A0ABS5VUH4_9BACT|nr:CHASE2 domain-containing protein [Chryseosolibacter indicus]MBT1705087.1 CHASE2 domain-containing protein [Chryseosolibacter indicus]
MKKLIFKGVAVTAFVFLSMWGFKGITEINLFSAFDPISQALSEFELTDYVFSKLRPDPMPDSRIVLVNIGPTRREIAQQVQIISQYKPKVIGIDGFFNCEGGYYDTISCPQLLDTLGNLMLSNAIQQAGNVVLVSRLLQTDSLFKTHPGHVFDSMEYSDPIFKDYAYNAYANLPTGDKDGNGAATYQEDVKICKSIVPRIDVNGREELAFAVKMAQLYDSVKTQKFLARNNYEEVINFRGNINISDVRVKHLRENMTSVSDYNALCYAIDWIPFSRGEYDPSMFENNVVIIGYLGDYFGDSAWEDKFFTPLNTKVAGRANPDMFGPVIHANVVAMILNEDYVNEIPEWLQIAIALVICFLNVLLFYWMEKTFPLLYDGLSVIVQLIEIIIVSALVVYFFATFNYKLELSLTIGALALIGPCFDIYKGVENTLIESLTRRARKVLTTQTVENT